MGITSLDQVGAGAQPPREFWKAVSVAQIVGRTFSFAHTEGIPGRAVPSAAGVAGEALTSYAGQLPFTNPTSGLHTHLSRFVASATQIGQLVLYDRLWHNSGLNANTLSVQSVNSVAFPARDRNGSTDGEDVMLAVEVVQTAGVGSPAFIIEYTNSAGVTGRIGNSFISGASSTAVGGFFLIRLQAGDTGMRSIQTYQQDSTWGASAAVNLVAYRVLARLEISIAFASNSRDWITGGAPRMYDDTVPFLFWFPVVTTATSLTGHVIWSQG